jgi:hypothetical protein
VCDVPGMQEPDGPFLSIIDADWVKLLLHVILSYETNSSCVNKCNQEKECDLIKVTSTEKPL